LRARNVDRKLVANHTAIAHKAVRRVAQEKRLTGRELHACSTGCFRTDSPGADVLAEIAPASGLRAAGHGAI
jgi:hypothetical protein